MGCDRWDRGRFGDRAYAADEAVGWGTLGACSGLRRGGARRPVVEEALRVGLAALIATQL